MLYNDDETRKEEERFQELLQYARNFTEEDKQALTEGLELLTEGLNKLRSKPKLTAEEIIMLKEIQEMMETVTEDMRIRLGILDESLLRQSLAYYEHVKKLAAEGDEKAKKIYDDLKGSYQEMLKENLGEN